MSHKNKVFQKAHIRISVLFTSVCSLILIITSVFYLYNNYYSIYNNSFIKFSSDIQSFSSSFSSEKVISHDFINNIQNSYDYSMFIYDNGEPFLFTSKTKSEEELMLIEEIRYDNSEIVENMHYSALVGCRSIRYNKNGSKKYIGIVSVPGENSNTDIFVIDYLENEMLQIRELCLKSAIIILLATSLIFVFSYFFTYRILQPVRNAHEQQQHFIAAASHEIRNPVNTIMAALDAMDKCNDEQKYEFKNIANKEGKRLVYLTEDLLTLARCENGKLCVNCAPAELDTLIVDCYEAFIAPAAEKGIRINIELTEEDFPKLSVDAEKIKQVISILLSNAVSYTDMSGVIDISYYVKDSDHIITIADNGPGISDEDKQHIFERFYRADRARENRSHFGLGLAIAKEIINMHQGKISVCDSKYGGAKFVILLPDKR
ncbi:MAG: HAMP domain-containing sensor histidine kinase [Oscillospiraceae bacterium]|nr:HAMP domain-containing sensor histidine kinase [Oscillospiraceae bacterium]